MHSLFIVAGKPKKKAFAALQILIVIVGIWVGFSLHFASGANGSLWTDTIKIYKDATTVHTDIRTFTNNETHPIDVTVEITSTQSIYILKYYKLSANGTDFVIISEGAVTRSGATYYGLKQGEKLCFTVEAKPIDSAAEGETATVEVQISYIKDASPTCSIADPASGQTISGVYRDKVNATDDKQVSKVELSINSGTWINITLNFDGTYYFYDWDTTKVSDGSHILDARTTDNATQTTYAPQVIVNVDNPRMHVERIDFKQTTTTKLDITVTIYDDTGKIVKGATVYMDIRYPDGSVRSVSAVTSVKGIATYTISRPAKGTYTVTVTTVTHATLTYDPSANKETTDIFTVK